MKLTVEIKDNRFNYSYQIGEETYNSSSHLSADFLVAFTEVIRHCSQVARKQSDDRFGEISGKAWIEQNPEAARKYLETKSWK